MLNVTIDGIKVQVKEGSTILQAAQNVGIEIPTLCYLKDLMPDASCRRISYSQPVFSSEKKITLVAISVFPVPTSRCRLFTRRPMTATPHPRSQTTFSTSAPSF